jgi:lysophospholipase L1-like esterase
MLKAFLLQCRNGYRFFAAVAGLSAALTGCAEGRPGPRQANLAALGPFAPLAPFYKALEAPANPVGVVQIGDSHTANDAFSGQMRALMQARFGDAGRGMLPPGIPYDYYRPATVHVSATGWQVIRSAEAGKFGLAGLRQHAAGPASMTIETDPGQLGHVTALALQQPGGGTLDVVAGDGRQASVSTAGPGAGPGPGTGTGPGAGSVRLPLSPGGNAAFVQLTARGDGPVDVLSWTVGTARPGVTWSNLGTIGATIEIVGRWDPALMRIEGAALAPALLVVAFGTNEGFKDSMDMAAYPGLVHDALHRLRAAMPGAAVLVLGPPAGVRAAGSGAGQLCPGTRFAVPANLPTVRRILHQVAAAEGAYFWDWAAAMGGDCAMVAWSIDGRAARDHVHLLKTGYQQTADALFAELMRGYERFKAAR